MNVELSLPNFQVETAGERRMYAYLHRTVQQLNWALKHLDQAEQTGYLQAATQPGGAVRQVTAASAGELKDLILKSADIVQSFSTAVSRKFQGQYVAQSAFGTYKEQTQLWVNAADKRIDQNYTSLQTVTGTVDALWEGMQSTNAYIRTGLIGENTDGTPVYGLEIGQTTEVDGSRVFSRYARFSSSRLSFYDQNDTEVAYISDYKLYITNIHITGTLTVGSYEIDTADGLAFRWIGEEA